MKNKIGFLTFIAIAAMAMTSCSKEDFKSTEVKNVVLSATLNPGEDYNLDLSPYGVQHATVSVTKEAVNIEGSKLTTLSTTPFNANYQYTGSCNYQNDHVILLVQEDDGTKGSAHNSCDKGSRPDKGDGHDKNRGGKSPHPAATQITINFTVLCASGN